MPKKIVSGNFFKDVERMLGFMYKKFPRGKKRSFLSWLKQEMVR